MGWYDGVVGASFAHDIKTQRAVRHLGGDVHHFRACVYSVEVLREGLPAKVHTLGQYTAWYVFYAFH